MSEIDKHTPKMVTLFQNRTKQHINRVVGNITQLLSYSEVDKIKLLQRAALHDASKYSVEEKIPYIWLTTFHDKKNKGKKFSYPVGVEELIKKATLHHITNNKHHPQYYKDPNSMTLIDVIEMVADWTAMAQELNQNNGSAKKFAEKKVIESKFNPEKIKLIFGIISYLDKKNRV